MLNDDRSASSISEPAVTGKFLVLFAEGANQAGANLLNDAGGLNVTNTAQFSASEVNPDLEASSALIYHNLGVAVINATPDQLQSISSAGVDGSANPILTIEPEMILYAQIDVSNAATVDESQQTWGLSATNVINSKFSGQGIRVAILDTGLDLKHPDFVDRTIISQSFVPNEEVQDGHGHGTHCSGTACGPRQPKQLPRYGVAYEANIYIGKVLDNEKGSGSDGTIIAGINWAVSNGCEVISMSIGGRSIIGQPYSQVYETLAKRALDQGSLIIAAAGNDSRRQLVSGAIINPVSRPANCPSIMAVAALDAQFKVGWFSNRGFNTDGGEINIAGPGVAVYSSWPMPTRCKTIDGTSMATPHVAGIAALLAEANPNARGKALWDLLIKSVGSLSLDAADIGAGIVQAP